MVIMPRTVETANVSAAPHHVDMTRVHRTCSVSHFTRQPSPSPSTPRGQAWPKLAPPGRHVALELHPQRTPLLSISSGQSPAFPNQQPSQQRLANEPTDLVVDNQGRNPRCCHRHPDRLVLEMLLVLLSPWLAFMGVVTGGQWVTDLQQLCCNML